MSVTLNAPWDGRRPITQDLFVETDHPAAADIALAQREIRADLRVDLVAASASSTGPAQRHSGPDRLKLDRISSDRGIVVARTGFAPP